jgi:hypothetical protein
MNGKRYFGNLFRTANRRFSAQTGGDPEEPNSSRWGKLRENRWWAKGLCNLLSKLYGQDDHCGPAAAKEDDGFRASDPTGRYFIALAVLWIIYRAVVILLVYQGILFWWRYIDGILL